MKKLILISLIIIFTSVIGYSQNEIKDDLIDALTSKIEEFKEDTKVKSIIAGVVYYRINR